MYTAYPAQVSNIYLLRIIYFISQSNISILILCFFVSLYHVVITLFLLLYIFMLVFNSFKTVTTEILIIGQHTFMIILTFTLWFCLEDYGGHGCFNLTLNTSLHLTRFICFIIHIPSWYSVFLIVINTNSCSDGFTSV